MKRKLLTVLLLSFLSFSYAFAEEVKLDDVRESNIKDPAYRVGLTDDPEQRFVEVKTTIKEDYS